MENWWYSMAIRTLTDEQWEKMRAHIPPHPKQPRGGRPWADYRKCLEGILWIMSTGAQWKELPARYPSPSTCWRQLYEWEQTGVFIKMWRTFLAELNADDRIKWEEAFADGTFATAKKGGPRWAKPKKAKVPKS
jgi:transposase